MKKILFHLLVLFAMLLCVQNGQSQVAKKTIVCGQKTNFNPKLELGFIGVTFHDILDGPTRVNVNINENGTFRIELDLFYPTEFLLNYNAPLTYYISPGDSLFFEISERGDLKVLQPYKERLALYKVSGTAQKMNEDISHYKAFIDEMRISMPGERIELYRNPMGYRSFIESTSNKVQEETNYFHKMNRTCETFRTWVAMDIKYNVWLNLMLYQDSHPTRMDMDKLKFLSSIPEEYFSFMDGWDKDDVTNLRSVIYKVFLNEYFVMKERKVRIDLGDDYYSLISTDFSLYFNVLRDRFIQEEEDYVRDVMVSKLYYSFLKANEYLKIKDSFDASVIKDKELHRRVVDMFNEEKRLYENPAIAAGSKYVQLAAQNDFLQALIKKYPNKVICLDFWAPWCIPCMGEVLYAKNLSKQFEGKDVVFVHLGNRCKEASWKATIAEMKIDGEHYYLNDKQFDQLNEIFGISVMPLNVIIDKSGTVKEKKAPLASSGDELRLLLEAYLNQ